MIKFAIESNEEIEQLKEAIKLKDSVLLRVKSFMQSVTTDDVTDIFREALSVGLSVSNETKKEVNATK